jgi:hypothetical protein
MGALVGFPGPAGDATAGVAAGPVVGPVLTDVAEGVPDDVGVVPGLDGVADGDSDGLAPGGDDWVVPADGVPAPVGEAVCTTATWFGPRALARCCSSTPPMPRAIVARTMFRTPRLRMSRAR